MTYGEATKSIMVYAVIGWQRVNYSLPLCSQMRRLFRPYFLGSRSLKMAYDVVTWFATHFILQFGNLVFPLLWLRVGILYWR